ncbi:MAG: DUF512 domain-containing protein, partial [Oscillospiraceae bacterium]
MAVKITHIQKGSPAQKHHIQAGDSLVSINGGEINDMLDLQFYSSDKRLKLLVKGEDGRQKLLLVTKEDEYQPLGLDFETYLIDKHHPCKNKCIFCFIDQLPKGMRESLYFKDDDERLSFLFGNYITLTNLSQKELERIKTVKISPINISVHTTNPQLRVAMMKNPAAARVNELMAELAQAGIKMNVQIVLCRGINDGKELENTIKDLQKLYPSVQSASIVPIGLTGYRQGLEKLETFDEDGCGQVIDLVEKATEGFFKEHGVRLVYLSDEFYLKAKRAIPSAEYYEDFPQIENGVGMVRTFVDNFLGELQRENPIKHTAAVDIATGEAFFPIMSDMAQKACDKLGEGLKIKVHCVKNNFFGGNVNVTALLTGQDLMEGLKGKLTSKRLVLCSDILRSEGDMLLDDTTPQDIEK